MLRLESLGEATANSVNRMFEELSDLMDIKKAEILAEVRRKKESKRSVLEAQRRNIKEEKMAVATCLKAAQEKQQGDLEREVNELEERAAEAAKLIEPRENSYIEFRRSGEEAEEALGGLLRQLGSVRTSSTFPGLCRAWVETAIVHLETVARVEARDHTDQPVTQGGDPMTVELATHTGALLETRVVDLDNGNYEVRFTPTSPGTYCLNIFIFARPIKPCPLYFPVTSHNSPLVSFGQAGTGEAGFLQPCCVAVGRDERVYVADTGNCRIKVLSSELEFIAHIDAEVLGGRSVTGLCLGRTGTSLVVANWRTRQLAELSLDGKVLTSFIHKELREPVSVAVSPTSGHWVVADIGARAVLVFEPSGKLVGHIGGQGELGELPSLAVGPDGEVLVADSKILVYSEEGVMVKEIGPRGSLGHPGSPGGQASTLDRRGRWRGLALDRTGLLLAVRADRGGGYLQVWDYKEGRLLSTVDSHGTRLRRPCGLAVGGEGRHAYLVDMASHCVRKFRYK